MFFLICPRNCNITDILHLFVHCDPLEGHRPLKYLRSFTLLPRNLFSPLSKVIPPIRTPALAMPRVAFPSSFLLPICTCCSNLPGVTFLSFLQTQAGQMSPPLGNHPDSSTYTLPPCRPSPLLCHVLLTGCCHLGLLPRSPSFP